MKLNPGVTIMLAGVSVQDYKAFGEACIAAGANVGEFPSARQRESMAAFGWSKHNNAMYHYCVKPASDTCHIVTVVEAFGLTDNDWHERGELPPVGVECEYYRSEHADWKLCKIEFIGRKVVVMSGVGGSEFCRKIAKLKFRPLKNEREKFIERMDREWQSQNKTLADFLGEQYDKGLRYVD